jgi:hypothetical protein
MNAYGALDPGLATPSLSCALFLLKQHKKAVDNADVVIHGFRLLTSAAPKGPLFRSGVCEKA